MIYPIKCQCGFAGDVFAKLADMQDGQILCPGCGRYAEQDYSRKNVASGNREFRGQRQESITEGWSPDEVGKVQREMASNGDTDAANCIDKEGTVRFKSRSEQQAYMRAKARIWQKVADGPSQTMEEAQLKVRAKVEARKAAKKAAYEKKHGPLARRSKR